MDLLIIAVVGLLAIAGATQISDRVRVAPALLLLAGGIVVGFLPVVPAIEVEPEIILEGILPPLLYATAVGISTINFRRELASVVVLAILLVIVSAAVIGGVLTLVIPGLSPAWAIAVGAVLSPTDAVAISIARRLGVSQRIITVLEGEGLLNDATALVVLSSASTAATAGLRRRRPRGPRRGLGGRRVDPPSAGPYHGRQRGHGRFLHDPLPRRHPR